MIKNYLKVAWRHLGKSKMHSFINIAGLSIGMAVAILIGLWMYDELSFDKNFKNYNRTAQVIQNVINNGEVQTWRGVPYPLADEIRKNYGSNFKHVVMAVDWREHLLTVNDKKLKQTGAYFEKGMAEMFSLQMVQGNWNGLNDPASIFISESAAKAYFGNDDPIDKMISIDHKPVVKITGIYKAFPHNSTFADLNFISSWDFFFSNDQDLRTIEDPWRPNFASLFVQLNDNADFKKASQRIKDAKLKRVNSQLQTKKPALFLHPMGDWHLHAEFKNGVNVGGAIQYVWMFGIIGVFVLLLACINFMNLSTARSEKRAKEVGVRKTVGSLRWQLIQQFFVESIFTTLLAFFLSLLWVKLALSFFNEIAEKQMSIPWSSPLFWILSIGFTFFTALIAGSYPAFYLSSFNPVKVLRGTFKAGRFAAIPRKVLVVIQFTVSVTLIIGTIIVDKQIQFAKDRPVGYNREGLISIPTPDSSIHQHFNAVRDELMRTGAISSIAESGAPITTIWGSSSAFTWKGKDPNLSIDFGTPSVSYDYGKTIGWHIKNGRDFSKDFSTDSTAVILNEAAARFMGLQNPAGETIMWFDKPYLVIGVINDMLMESPYDMVRPIIYYASTEPGNFVIIKINPGASVKEALSRIEPVFRKFDPEQPFEYQFVDNEYAKKFGDEERIGRLATLFAALAIVISCLGLFGLTSFVAEQRKKEIGVRKVLGASVLSVCNLLSRDFVALVCLSFLISAPLAWYAMHKWLQDFSYRITISWGIFLLAGAIAITIALITVSFQAMQAAFANPVKSLRTE
jgi:putative ABC transport system permease protein